VVDNFITVKLKLERFIKKYYVNELIRGLILFAAIGLLYFLFTLLIEYILWLKPVARTLLFWVFVIVELSLFIKLIISPTFKLLKLKQGLNYIEASRIVGEFFPEVKDKLINVIQLHNTKDRSELLLASIQQKSLELKPVPFSIAVNFSHNLKYLKYLAIPLLIVTLSFISGHMNWFSDSYNRVVNYQTAYDPPAPFRFLITNQNLNAIENNPFKLVVTTSGNVVPEDVQIFYQGEAYFLKQSRTNEFEYVFSKPQQPLEFIVSANGVFSETYRLNVIAAPTILGFEMVLNYPAYTKKKDESFSNNGNASVPQGTKITWNVRTKSTTQLRLVTDDSVFSFLNDNDNFKTSQRVHNNLKYLINTSNESLENYESLAFSINILKDELPRLKVEMNRDSVELETLYFYGQASDDYGLNKLELIYYQTDTPENKFIKSIPIKQTNFDEFIYIFPNNLDLDNNVSYELYFKIYDNDIINGYKSVKSELFRYRKRSVKELALEKLNNQKATITDLNRSLNNFDKQDLELKNLTKNQKEKSNLSFSDKKNFKEFLKRQKNQERLMQNYNKNLMNNLKRFEKEDVQNDFFKEAIENRLKENQEQLLEDEKLLKELEELSDKLQKEQLTDKLEQLAKQNKNKKRSLQQLLELTKRYYVSKKAEQLKMQIEELAKKQLQLSEEDMERNTKDKQEKLSDLFDTFKKDMQEIDTENKQLKDPIEGIKRDPVLEKLIEKELKNALNKLDKKENSLNKKEQQNDHNNAQKSQKKASQKMKEMGQLMSQTAMGGGGDQMSEDIDVLRQILDNLLLFSFNQEALMMQFKNIQVNHNKYAQYLKRQQDLKVHFEHVDDSLFALSLRQPMISERINKEITEVFFYMNKTLSQLEDNRLYQGVASQQYTVTSSNTLANFLSDLLDNMESQMNPTPGQGEGSEMQLPDIIMSQEQLNQEMKQGLSGLSQQENGDKEGTKGLKEDGEPSNKGPKGAGNSSDESEYMQGQLFKVFQQQQVLRQALKDKLNQMGVNSEQGNNLLKDMEEIETDLLNDGFTDRLLQKMADLKHNLLKLEKAELSRGEDTMRQSSTNKDRYQNSVRERMKTVKNYFNTTEILNRQLLPLRQEYKDKVKEYFSKIDD